MINHEVRSIWGNKNTQIRRGDAKTRMNQMEKKDGKGIKIPEMDYVRENRVKDRFRERSIMWEWERSILWEIDSVESESRSREREKHVKGERETHKTHIMRRESVGIQNFVIWGGIINFSKLVIEKYLRKLYHFNNSLIYLSKRFWSNHFELLKKITFSH